MTLGIKEKYETDKNSQIEQWSRWFIAENQDTEQIGFSDFRNHESTAHDDGFEQSHGVRSLRSVLQNDIVL